MVALFYAVFIHVSREAMMKKKYQALFLLCCSCIKNQAMNNPGTMRLDLSGFEEFEWLEEVAKKKDAAATKKMEEKKDAGKQDKKAQGDSSDIDDADFSDDEDPISVLEEANEDYEV